MTILSPEWFGVMVKDIIHDRYIDEWRINPSARNYMVSDDAVNKESLS